MIRKTCIKALKWASCFLLAAAVGTTALAQSDVTQPGDEIIATSDNSPGSEGVANAIDGQPTKYLNRDINNTGFTVTPSVGATIVTGLTLESANDAEDRDPTTYELAGSNDGSSFQVISSGSVEDFPTRFFTNRIDFDNNIPYTTYRLIFPTVDNSGCCMQIAEVEFLGEVVDVLLDVTQPGDDLIATSDNSPGSEGVANAIDGQPTKYLNRDIENTGFTVTPSIGSTIVTALTLQSANDAEDRDPTSYLLEGSNDGSNFSEISSGPVADFPTRFFTNRIDFNNTTPYLMYRLIFPTVDNSGCCMQIAEVEFLGEISPIKDVTQPGDDIIATSDNSPGSEGVANAIDGQPTKYLNRDIVNTGFTVTPSVGGTLVTGLTLQSANDAEDRDPTSYLIEGSLDGQSFFTISEGPVADFPDRFFTNTIFFDNNRAFATYRLIFPTVDNSGCCMQIAEVEFLGVTADLPTDVTLPGDDIIATSDNSPGSEGVANAIDGQPTKYLNRDINNTGFTVWPSIGATTISGIRLQSANDAEDRDPINYTIEGSNDGGQSWQAVAAGDVPDFPDRFFLNTLLFDNSTPYVGYRVLFPEVDGSGCCMQIAEVELLGFLAPGDVTQPGDPLIATSDNSPGSEGVANAIDGQPTKYLNRDITNTGFTVTPSVGKTVVTGLTLQSANDAEDRDPTSYLLEGSNDGVSFTEISSGSVPDFPDRFWTNHIWFENSELYATYRLIFPTVDNSGCCMQIAEVEFLGSTPGGDLEPCEGCNIKVQPQATPSLVGASATFRVIPTGPWKFQWFVNDEKISGAVNASYTTPPITADNDGDLYHVEVAGGGFLDTSTPGELLLFTPADTVSIGLSWIGSGANGAPTAMETSDITGFHQQAYWNNMDGNDFSVLKDSNNDDSAVIIDFTADGTWGSGTGEDTPTTRMLNGILRVAGTDFDSDAATMFISGVPAGNHSLIFYSVQVPLEFFNMAYEVSYFDADFNEVKKTLYMRPQNSDEYNPSPGFIRVEAETIETQSVGNMVRFDNIAPSDGTITVRMISPARAQPAGSSDAIRGPGLNGMQILLNAEAPPLPATLASQPSSTNGIDGEEITLTAEATGEDISFQWLKDGQPVFGATESSLVIPFFSEGLAGNYAVAVSNLGGRIVSDAAVVSFLADEGTIDQGLIAHYKFDETSGSTASNSSGGADNGNVQGSASWGSGQVGNALNFDGSSTYVLVNEYPKPESTISLSVWVKANTLPEFAYPIVGNWDPSDPSASQNGQFTLSLEFPFTANSVVPNLSTTIAVGPNVPAVIGNVNNIDEGFPSGSWEHVVVTADSRTLTLFRNGEILGGSPYLGDINTTPAALRDITIGANTVLDENGNVILDEVNVDFWDGQIDDLGIWNRALSSAEVAAIYAQGVNGNDLSTALVERVAGTDPGPGPGPGPDPEPEPDPPVLGEGLVAVDGGLSRVAWDHEGDNDLEWYPADSRGKFRLDLVDMTLTRRNDSEGNFVPHFETPNSGDINVEPEGNIFDNYTAVLYGFLIPPETGTYRFAIASDDPSELYLSTDEDPENTQLIASEPAWNGVRNFGTLERRNPDAPENLSASIDLVAGNKYYVEAIFKEGLGGDNLAVAWKLPGDDSAFVDKDLPISGEFLSGFAPPVPGTLYVEAEDFDFDGGNWVSDVNTGLSGPYAGNAYDGLGATQGIDFEDTGSTRAYRTTGDPGPSVDKQSGPDDVRNARDGFIVETNWILGWNDPGDWYSYTRDFPHGSYWVSGDFSSGGEDISVQLDIVTDGAGTDAQTLEKLGEFNGAATGNWDVFAPIQMANDDGSPAVISLGGVQTLRLTTLPGNMDVNFLKFTPKQALYIEAEDFDFDGGSWIAGGTGFDGPYPGDAYNGLGATQGIDFDGAGSTRAYRTTGDPGPSVDKESAADDVRN
ncbi:MAG TPA: hypothetical protein EYQ50_13540, partial [Verrucomicrobiales bacterium]|nr:hypothetical protein [Verrucomicrobiales bacterium]